MNIEVGQIINYKGRERRVSCIANHEVTALAELDSDVMQHYTNQELNCIYHKKHFDKFLEGDIITTTLERITLMSLDGKDALYIYTNYNVKKEEDYDARTNTDESEPEQSPSEQAEGSRDGHEDGEVIRDESSSTAN